MSAARVVWTPKMQKRAEPRRGSKPAKRIKRDVQQTWADVRKIWALIDERCKAAVKTRPESHGEITLDLPLTDAVVAWLDQENPPKENDPVTFGGARGLFEYAGWANHMNTIDALANHALAAGGATLAIAALSEAPKYVGWFDQQMVAVRKNLRGDAGYFAMDVGPWRLVRAELATLDDVSYAAARDVAAKCFDAGDLGVRSSIAFAFPAETTWVERAVRECLAHKAPRVPVCMTPLLASVSDAKLAEEIVAKAPYGLDWCPSLVAGIGADAAPLLIRIYAQTHRAPDKRKLLESLALVHSPEAAAHFATLVEDAALRTVVFEYFKAAPDLARAALAPLASKPTSEAAKLLALVE